MDNITFEQLPQAVSLLIERVGQLTSKVEEALGKNDNPQSRKHKLLTLDEVAVLLNKSASTIYTMTSEKRIPYHKQGNKLYFFEDEIIHWIDTALDCVINLVKFYNFFACLTVQEYFKTVFRFF